METLTEKAPTKRDARKQDRRAAILAIAHRHFMDNGYSAASMSAISAELGGSKGTLWSYFASKEELFAAVLDDATSTYRLQLMELLRPAPDVHFTIRQFAHSLITKITSRPAIQLHRLIAAEAGRNPEIGQIFFRRAPQRTQEMLAAMLAEAMAAGQLRRDDPMRAARALTGLCMTGLHHSMLMGREGASEEEIAEEADYAAAIFMRAFGPESEAG